MAGSLTRLRHGGRGQSLVEAAVVLPILLVLAFGVIEFGHFLLTAHELTSLSREGANLASRGTALDTSLSIVMANGEDLKLGQRGGAIVSKMQFEDGNPRIKEQQATSGFSGRSRFGNEGEYADGVRHLGMKNGTVIYGFEVMYSYQKLTPLSRMVAGVMQDTLYRFTIF